MNSCWPLVTVRPALLGFHLTDDGTESQRDYMVCPNHKASKGAVGFEGDRLTPVPLCSPAMKEHAKCGKTVEGQRQLSPLGT